MGAGCPDRGGRTIVLPSRPSCMPCKAQACCLHTSVADPCSCPANLEAILLRSSDCIGWSLCGVGGCGVLQPGKSTTLRRYPDIARRRQQSSVFGFDWTYRSRCSDGFHSRGGRRLSRADLEIRLLHIGAVYPLAEKPLGSEDP